MLVRIGDILIDIGKLTVAVLVFGSIIDGDYDKIKIGLISFIGAIICVASGLISVWIGERRKEK